MAAIAYECDDHGVVPSCDIDQVGERVCPECGNHVTVIEEGS